MMRDMTSCKKLSLLVSDDNLTSSVDLFCPLSFAVLASLGISGLATALSITCLITATAAAQNDAAPTKLHPEDPPAFTLSSVCGHKD